MKWKRGRKFKWMKEEMRFKWKKKEMRFKWKKVGGGGEI